MKTKYFVDDQGRYLGAYCGVKPPAGAIEVSVAPIDARMIWTGQGYEMPAEIAEADLVKAHVTAIQAHMDAQAQALGYDDIRTAVTYAEEPAVPKFQEEGKAFRAWRSMVWDYAYAQLDLVKAGEREAPTVEQMIDELPEAPDHG